MITETNIGQKVRYIPENIFGVLFGFKKNIAIVKSEGKNSYFFSTDKMNLEIVND